MSVFALILLIIAAVLVVAVPVVLQRRRNRLVPRHDFDDGGESVTVRGGTRVYRGNTLRHDESGLWELTVAGGDFDRGFAIGKLTEDLLYYQEKVFVEQIRRLVPSNRYLRFLRCFILFYNRNLGANVAEEYRNEIYGLSRFCSDDWNVIGSAYKRQLNYHSAHDIGHALQDYMMVGCSSFACRGHRSADGKLIVGRNFDFWAGDDFARNKIVQFVFPEKGWRFASVSWPGMVGVLSGMNEKGLTVTINAAKSALPLSAATPISLLTREILQYASTIEEAVAIARRRRTFVSESILVGSAADGAAVVIEKSPRRMALCEMADDCLLSTNHFQSEAFRRDRHNRRNMATSDSVYRLHRLRQLLDAGPVDALRAAAILRDRNGIDGKELGMTNEAAINQLIAHHSVIFRPEDLLMWVSAPPWQCGKYLCYDLKRIFAREKDFFGALSEPEAALPADAFLSSKDYQNLQVYRSLKAGIEMATAARRKVEPETISQFLASNPSFYYVYELIGNYCLSLGNKTEACRYWRKALDFPLPKAEVRTSLEKKLRKHGKKS